MMESRTLATADSTDKPRASTGGPEATLQVFLHTLRQRYAALRDVDASTVPDAPDVHARLSGLMLAEAGLRYAAPSHQPGAKRPLQIAVLGPTQTGKSTIVNLIVGSAAASVSPLASYTVHPQGFWIGADAADERWITEIFPGWTRCPAADLERGGGSLERFCVERLGDGTTLPAGLPPCVVWDTPDFDSLTSHTYRRAVLEVAALADAHVLVLSKEKYADLSVWRMLRLLQPLGRPLLVCLNKATPDAIEPLTASLRKRLAELDGAYAETPIVALEYETGFDATAGVDALPEAWELRDRIDRWLTEGDAPGRRAGLRKLVSQHWADWVTPVEAEIAARQAWDEVVAQAVETAVAAYKRDFLEHPQRFDTFRRATVELLHLLELPGLGSTLSQVRHVLTWPARQLFTVRQAWAARKRAQGGLPRGLGSEEVVLFEIVEKLLTTLEREAARRTDPTSPAGAVWHAILQQLQQHDERLRATYQEAVRTQRTAFAPRIGEAANRLYELLQKRPAVLNTLRAARATTDVAAIAVAVKTAGLGINDLLFAPAMLSLSSMLTEGALGSYMQRVSNELKKEQREHMREHFFENVIARELVGLSESLSGGELLGIDEQQYAEATEALKRWEQSA